MITLLAIKLYKSRLVLLYLSPTTFKKTLYISLVRPQPLWLLDVASKTLLI